MCELSFQLKDGSRQNIEDLRKFSENGGNILEKIKDAKMKVVWPHERPKPTGEVRAKLIHQRMHKKREENIKAMGDFSPAQMLQALSSGFVIIATLPLVAYALYKLMTWFGVDHEKSKIYSLLLSIVFLLAEMGLILIQSWKEDKTKEFMLKQFNSPVHIVNNEKPKQD